MPSIFYRATLCVSAVLAVGWFLSVRLSVRHVHVFQTAKDIVKLYSWCVVAPLFCFFSNPSAVTQFQVEPHTGNSRFLTEIAVYLRNGTRHARGFYGTLTGSHR